MLPINPVLSNNSSRSTRASAIPALIVSALFLSASIAGAAVDPPSITSPAPGAVVASPVTIAGTAPGQYVAVRVMEGVTMLAETGTTGGLWSVALALSDGTHTLTAVGRDAANALGAPSASVTFTVDTVAPAQPSITAPVDGALLAFSSFDVEGTAEPGSTVALSVSTGAPLRTTTGPDGIWRISRTWTDTTHTVAARAFDAAGNASTVSPDVRFTVDTTPPTAPTIDTPSASLYTNQTSVAVSGRAEHGAHVLVAESSQIADVVADGTGRWGTVLAFAPGTHAVSARARDAAGNTGPSSGTTWFTVDTTPPLAPTIDSPEDDALVSAAGAILSGSAEPRATVQLVMGYNIVSAETVAGADGYWTMPFPHPFAGTYSITVRARDRAGNSGPSSPARTFTIDTSPPTVTVSTPPGSIFTPLNPPLIEGTVHDDHAVSRVLVDFYDLTGRGIASYRATCYGCGTADAHWTLTQTPLVGRFVVRAYAYDTVGNKSEYAETTAVIVRVN